GHHAHLALALLILAPRTHDEGVVDRDAPHLVHALGLELVDVLHVARHVLGRAGGRERAGQTEEHDLLSLGQLAHLERVGADRAARPLGLDELGQRSLGELVAYFDRHRYLLLIVGGWLPGNSGSISASSAVVSTALSYARRQWVAPVRWAPAGTRSIVAADTPVSRPLPSSRPSSRCCA